MPKQIERAQKASRTTATKIETIKRASDVVIDESKRDRLARRANVRFLNSRVEIADVYGKLTE